MGDLVLWLVVVCLACYLQRMDKPLDFVDGAHVNAGRHWFLNKKRNPVAIYSHGKNNWSCELVQHPP